MWMKSKMRSRARNIEANVDKIIYISDQVLTIPATARSGLQPCRIPVGASVAEKQHELRHPEDGYANETRTILHFGPKYHQVCVSTRLISKQNPSSKRKTFSTAPDSMIILISRYF